MLRIEAEIGDQVEVTFIKTQRGLQAQERVNNRCLYLSNSSWRPRPGDRCRVLIASENQQKSVYHGVVAELLEGGDGSSSLLQKMLRAIHYGAKKRDALIEVKVIEGLGKRFGSDRQGLLEFLLDMLESQVYMEFTRLPSNYEPFGTVINRLITEVAADDAPLHIAYLLRSADCCMHRENGFTWAETFTDAALQLTEREAPQMEVPALEMRDELNRRRGIPESRTKRKLLDKKERYVENRVVRRTIHPALRNELARDLMIEAPTLNAAEVIEILQAAEKVFRREDNIHHFTLFANLMSSAFHALGNSESASWWFAQAKYPHADPDALDEIAAGIRLFGRR